MGSTPQGVHLVGSLPASSTEEVFRQVSAVLGNHLERVPDGELGDRSSWIAWQHPVFGQVAGLELVPVPPDAYVPRPIFKVREGASEKDIAVGSLGYAKAALESYEIFSRLKREGSVAQHLRFQVGLPSPAEPVIAMLEPGSQAQMSDNYEERMRSELTEIIDKIPHNELAIQWEIVFQIAVLEGLMESYFSDPATQIPAKIAELLDLIPEGVQTGMHLCYGDARHRHFMEPQDTGLMVKLCEATLAQVHRRLDWVHMPVPRGKADVGYFKPLAGLRLPAETRLFLGLVHHTDGEAGTRKRLDAAEEVVESFGIGTECGMGRRPQEQVAELLEMQARLAAPVV